MVGLSLPSEAQMARIAPHFPLAHGVPRVDDRRVVSGMVYVIKHVLQRKDAPKGYGPHKTLDNRFIRWSRMGVFDRIFSQVLPLKGRSRSGSGSTPRTSRRTARLRACSKRGSFPLYRAHQGRAERQASRRLR